jgi:hypothetical protein
MPAPRLTIPKQIWAKLQTQSTKKDNGDLAAGLRLLRVSLAPGGDAVLWDPPKEALAAIERVLVREETYTRDRNKGNCQHQAMLKTIELVKRLQASK